MNEKRAKNITTEILTRCLNRNRPCFHGDCNENSIQSHLLQKNGIVNQLSNNGHMYSVKFVPYPSSHYTFKREGINEALTFRGFCNVHDTSIFQEIEKKDIKFESYRSLLILSYRSVLKELRDKEIMIDFYNRIKSSSEVKNYYNSIRIEDSINIETQLSWDIEYIIACIEEDLKNKSESFEFEILEIPRVEICASAIYSLTSLNDSYFLHGNKNPKKELIPCIVVNIFPTNDKTMVLFGYHKISKPYCELALTKFFSNDIDSVRKHISDLLIKNFATWVCSENFFNSNIKSRKDEIIRLMNYFTKRKQFSHEEINFNIFQE